MTVHREGSRRQKVHKIFDEQADAAALVLGQRLKLKDSSVRTWISKWRAETVKENLDKNAKAKKAKSKKVANTTTVDACSLNLNVDPRCQKHRGSFCRCLSAGPTIASRLV
jgi:hypothetical protein